jgi:hypothetical protein
VDQGLLVVVLKFDAESQLLEEGSMKKETEVESECCVRGQGQRSR